MYHIDLNSKDEITQSQQALDAHVIVSVTDKLGNITYANEQFCNISGYSRDELLGQNHRLLKSNQHTAEFYQSLWQTISSGQTWSGELCNRKKDGSYYWVKTSITPFLDENGAPYKYVSYRTDITDIKRQEQTHKALLNATAECIQGLDKEGRCIFINPAATAILGYSEQELIGQRLHDLIHHHKEDGTLYPESECAVFQTIRDKQQRRLEDWFIRKDGSGFPVELIIAPRFENNEFVGVLLSYHDITDRKLAEDKLRRSEERLSFAIEGANDGVWDWDITTGYVAFSKLYAEMLGYKQDELTPNVTGWADSLHPDDREYVFENLQNYLDGKQAKYELEFRLKCKDGSWKWVLSRGKVITFDQGDNPIRMSGIHTDISARKALEEELRKAKDYAEQANRAKSAFLSSMSHELRTPLNAILGFGQLLMCDPKTPLAPNQQSSVDHILSGGKHLLSLIDEVLQLSAIEAGKVELTIEKLPLNESVNEIFILTETLAKTSNIEVNSSIDDDVFVLADHTKLKQVLLNLLSNAIKYNRTNGSVDINGTVTDRQTVRVSIIDSGIGISERNQPKLFSAFNRLGQELSSVEGTGIGLVVTKGLIDIMNGTIGYESKVGQGSTFWFELPITPESTVEPDDGIVPDDTADTNLLNLGKNTMRHILYVEDNQANSEVMQTFFDMHEHIELHIAETAELGLEKMSSKQFDLILMDINLPGMDGQTLTELLKKQQDFQYVPIIAITANAMPEDIENASEVFDAYITKPVDFVLLTEELNRFL